jgi:hypothetical protein
LGFELLLFCSFIILFEKKTEVLTYNQRFLYPANRVPWAIIALVNKSILYKQKIKAI